MNKGHDKNRSMLDGSNSKNDQIIKAEFKIDTN